MHIPSVRPPLGMWDTRRTLARTLPR
jgi:hypothetical protein